MHYQLTRIYLKFPISQFFSLESDDEEEIDDDDLDLIQENTGIKIKKVLQSMDFVSIIIVFCMYRSVLNC